MIDLLLLVVIGVSALLGLMKGFVGIVVGTLSWLLSGWATFLFGDTAAHWLAEGAQPSMTNYLGGYALVFVGVMVLVALIGMAVRSVIQATRLTGTDRALGFALGALRGAFFSCILILLMGFTPMPREAAWNQSLVLPLLLPAASWMRAQLPDFSMPDVDMGKLSALDSAKDTRLDVGKLPAAGDNAALNEMMKGGVLSQVVSRALTGAAGQNPDADDQDPAKALPSNIDPAQVRQGQPDPARVESPGQVRPPSR
jgi:membrane protein required for colicin V production